MKFGIEGVMDEWRQMQERINELQKENTELHECLNEAIVYLRGHANTYKCERDCKDCELACKGRKWRTALEGGNHAND